MMRKLWVSISGGRTSAYMAIKLQTEYRDRFDLKFIFANTGIEHEETLSFLDRIDRKFSLDVVWLEANVNHEERKSSSYKIVDFISASRNGEPFEEVIKKYGIPNMSYPHCTRELKIRVMENYIKSIGWKYEFRAIGIRYDETNRISEEASKNRIYYPLIDFFPTEKWEVLDWFKNKDYDLNINESLGNCVTCWKKTDSKLMRIMNDNPSSFDFFDRMEKEYGLSGSNEDGTKRVFLEVIGQ